MRPFHSILSALLRLLQLVMPASWGRSGRGTPSNNGRRMASNNGKRRVSKAPPCTNGYNQHQVTSRKHENVDNNLTSKKLMVAEEQLSAVERVGLRRGRATSTRWGLKNELDPDRIYRYMIYARVPKRRQPINTRDWYESFIPKVPDDTQPWKKPALTSVEFYGFNAALSPLHVEEMEKKMPGFISSSPPLARSLYVAS